MHGRRGTVVAPRRTTPKVVSLPARMEWAIQRIALGFSLPTDTVRQFVTADHERAVKVLGKSSALTDVTNGNGSPRVVAAPSRPAAMTASAALSAAATAASVAADAAAAEASDLPHPSLDALLAGLGPAVLFVYYQPLFIGGGQRFGPPKSELFYTYGHLEPVTSKCVYFLRTVNGTINASEMCDSTLLSGEVSSPAQMLDSLALMVRRVFQPRLQSQRSWGETPADEVDEFISGVGAFADAVEESIRGMGGGMVLLAKPDPLYDLDTVARDASAGTIDMEVAKHFEALLESWCSRISRSLHDAAAAAPTPVPDAGTGGAGFGSTVAPGAGGGLRSASAASAPPSSTSTVKHGPQRVLAYWRRRMQRLTSVTEQLKRKELRTVISVLQSAVKADRLTDEIWRASVFSLLRRWKQIDVEITEAAVEAKDNVKYLGTLEKFLEPLYTGTPVTIIDTLPALLNGIKMVFTIARYFNTTEHMEDLLSAVSNQLMVACRTHVLSVDSDGLRSNLWKKDPERLCAALRDCLTLRQAYEEQYRFTQEQLRMANPSGRQFDFSDRVIFGQFDLFCRRVNKLIEMFGTIQQFRLLSHQQLEGMEDQVSVFFQLTKTLRRKRHDLLDYDRNDFDRDYVEFNARILELETELQEFIHSSFDGISSIEQSLALLRKFQSILQRDALKADLEERFVRVFQTYGKEVELVNALFQRHKQSPPIPRNLPPVAGNIMWGRHLLKRISEPMMQFEAHPNVLAHREAQRIVKAYNKLAKKLVSYECLWHMAWVDSIDASKLAGLQATLLIRHPDDGKLYVNFDHEIWQLVREARCLDRMGGLEIPEPVRIVLLQEQKFKTYYDQLTHLLREYARVANKIIPVTAALLRPHLADIEFKLRPGLITLTWSSMNIDAYRTSVQTVLHRFEEMVTNLNDIIENRIEKNLRLVSKVVLVSMPSEGTFAPEEFVRLQEAHIEKQAALLQAKNVEIERAVEDLLALVLSYPLDADLHVVDTEEVDALRKHYDHFMYQALLNCTRNSLAVVKRRVGYSAGLGLLFMDTPFFRLEVRLAIPDTVLSPTLDKVQEAVNQVAKAILTCSQHLWDWGQEGVPLNLRRSFFERITQDIEVVRFVLLLTGTLYNTKARVSQYLEEFDLYSWLWTENADAIFQEFIKKNPDVDDYEQELIKFMHLENEIDAIPSTHTVGPLLLDTATLKEQLKEQTHQWRFRYSNKLHGMAQRDMAELHDYMKSTVAKIQRPVEDIDSLRFVMDCLLEVRSRESGIDHVINPVLDMYAMLERYLPDGSMDKTEMDQKSILRASWGRLLEVSEEVTDRIATLQVGFKRQLLNDIRDFVSDVEAFRADYLANGPAAAGITPQEAMDRLRRYHDEYELLARRENLYRAGQTLFAMPLTKYPELDATKRELSLLDSLYTLYREVMQKEAEWNVILWSEVVVNVSNMSTEMDAFHTRCQRLPAMLRGWDAYKQLRQQIENYVMVLPLLVELSKPSIRDRHWKQIEAMTECTLDVKNPEFKLQDLLSAKLVDHHLDIEELVDGADKELGIESKLAELHTKWTTEEFHFTEWRGRDVNILMGVTLLLEDLEESQLNLQTMLTMRHITPFKDKTKDLLAQLSNASETLELWSKVQTLWCSLESVFLGGDIARQMPVVARRFAKIDKDWLRVMRKAYDTALVVEAASNELLRASLPVMYSELEKCQKNLEGYLEQKRNKFPRFYFVSVPVLLQILSQGSDPQAVQPFYEKIFDSITAVEHDRRDNTLIREFINKDSAAEERIGFSAPVSATGNIEEWLMSLLQEMQRTMKLLCEECACDVQVVSNFVGQLREFVDQYCAQYALLGIQFMWTADVQGALEQCRMKRGAVRDAMNKANNVLAELSSWCLQNLGSHMNRKKIETLVTVQVHQRDVISELYELYKEKALTSAEDFEWLKQSRFFWDPDGTDFVSTEGSCHVSVTDVDFGYQYEYLGTKERLVITPLTDRCYITLAQAVGMYYGGAPAGPAGTGKTETTKDMGRAMGIFVVVTNCTPEMRYTDCAKIFKGLCQAGLWGCFDEFNRIELPVLSVVAQQVLAVNNAKKNNADTFEFPGDAVPCRLNSNCGFFITLNPPVKGYSGRQQLPENLKALFRGVAMMVPDFEIIIKVKLCSVGYSDFQHLAKKFQICYALCDEQLSQQRHYDFGLRNILSVLRSAGQTKRDNRDMDEDELLFRTLRDMNLSKLVAQDVPLFLSMLQDVFPSVPAARSVVRAPLMDAITEAVKAAGLVDHDAWVLKVVQLYETQLVRHGIMLTGPTGGGKTKIFEVLQVALSALSGVPYRLARMNPKAFRVQDMYGETDLLTGEWTQGVFSALWEKYNNRNNAYVTWIVCDGPVDTIWVESMNTVLDDNKMLTLASGDRIPMTDNTKLMFENEHLVNASPATVSRAGIVYVSDVDLGWLPVAGAWVATQPADRRPLLHTLFRRHVGEETPTEPGHVFEFLARRTAAVMPVSRVGAVSACFNLLQSLLADAEPALASATDAPDALEAQLERLLLYAMTWSLGGVLEGADRVKWDAHLRRRAEAAMPPTADGSRDTVYDYHVDVATLEWVRWQAPVWRYPAPAPHSSGKAKAAAGDAAAATASGLGAVEPRLDFSNLLVPTADSARALAVLSRLHALGNPVLLTGAPGTAKTSTALMFFATFDSGKRLVKRYNFSSATTPQLFQAALDAELDKRGGKSFGPPNGLKMTVFIDDLCMPEINKWGDQPTNELVRQLVETNSCYFLEKDKRGDLKVCEDLQYVGAMTSPDGGRNDVPARLKRHFFVFSLVPPDLTTIDEIYGQMLRGRFPAPTFPPAVVDVCNRLTHATIELWRVVKAKMLPTPSKFHYVFNMRDLSRVFQGILLTPSATILTGGQQTPGWKPDVVLMQLWKHEACRVLADKLTTNDDKAWFYTQLERVVRTHYGDDMAEACRAEAVFVDFFRDDVYDEDGVFVCKAPLVYEPGGSLRNVRARVKGALVRHNAEHPANALELVLFDDALRHLVRIARIISAPRGSALLVGVGGSGKQSLTRLAAYVAQSQLFTIALTKTYTVASLLDDLRELYRIAGQARQSVTFLFTDGEIKEEAFLEYLNSVLLTGEVSGLFAKDEMMALCGELRAPFQAARPGLPETPDNLKRYFVDCVRDNLHVVLCMSPVDPRFAERARKFPGLISGCTIDWFLPWPDEALESVARGFLRDFTMAIEDDVKYQVVQHVAAVHKMVVDVSVRYYQSLRRHVSQTPKSYLSFIRNFMTLYARKLADVQDKEARVHLGLEKLMNGAEDVERMKLILAEEKVKLGQATEETNAMLGSLEVSSLEAEKEAERVAVINTACEAEANRIRHERDACEADLALAKPFLEEAKEAIKSIQPAHIIEMRTLKKPSDIIRVVLDGVLLLLGGRLTPVTLAALTINKQSVEFIAPSWASAQGYMADMSFLRQVQEFAKDKINEETIELLLPYIDMADFNPMVARIASVAAEGLCVWVRAMKFYHEASKIVKPKLEALELAEQQMVEAQRALADAQARLEACKDRMAALRAAFDEQMARKQAIADNAVVLQKQMEQASALIQGLSGERMRWTDDSNNFADTKRRLVGDCAIACAFTSYCGPFNQAFRAHLLHDRFAKDAAGRGIPFTAALEVSSFLVDVGTVGDWNMQGLPTDSLSIQNGILVTQAARYPLLIDPQGQGLAWLKNLEADNMPLFGVCALGHPQLRERLEFCMQEGRSLVVVGVGEELDPVLDPVLERRYVTRGRRKYVNMGGKQVEVADAFRMYFTTRLANPHFSPELQAKTTVVDFTVTLKGLEEQLLGLVITREQKALEDLLTSVLEEVNANTKALIALDAELLERLTQSEGKLLDDEDLIGVLAGTKARAADVKDKLLTADDTRRSINEKREQFRPVATRGSVLYFSIVDMSNVNVMYQTSLAQFIQLFTRAMDTAEKSSLATKRVQLIIDAMTYLVYRYVNKGLYDRDKLLFVFLVTVKTMVAGGMLEPSDLALFQRAGAALDINAVRKRPSWMTPDAWLNAVALCDNPFFSALADNVARNEAVWRRWYEDNEPEALPVPDFELSIADNRETGPWLRLLLIRCLRPDRTLLQMKSFVRAAPTMGPRFTEPVTDTIETVYADMEPHVPVVFLLAVGADPTDSIEQLAKKRKQTVTCVSLGEGQEPVAVRAIQTAAAAGTWVLLQNCELGLPLMEGMEDMMLALRPSLDPGFRLFMTALPNPGFPLGLLQMCTKVCNEPPAGLKAGLLRSYTVVVDQDRLERIDAAEWRQLVFALCFFHSIALERRKFGGLGWCQTYDFNNGDLAACITFLERHLYSGVLSWPTVQYMVAQVQYGGKVTDNMDRRLLQHYVEAWLGPAACDPRFSFTPQDPVSRATNSFNYHVLDAADVDTYRKYVSSFPEVDSPEVFGLHPNADLTYRVKEVDSLLATMSETQPRQSTNTSGVMLDDVVQERAAELLAKLPPVMADDDCKTRLRRLGGLEVPLNIFLYQELQRLRRVVELVHSMLRAMQQAIGGEVVLTPELQAAMNDMFDAKVPDAWVWTPNADELSWIAPSLGQWFASLLERDRQMRAWLTGGRPNTYWLTGFFNPQGFLTAMKQEVTRAHKRDHWALDDVVYSSEVTEWDKAEAVRAPPRTGVYVHGLFLEAAAWSKTEASLVESAPKKLFAPLPVIHVTAMTSDMLRARVAAMAPHVPYECPVYKYAERTDRYLIFFVNLPTKLKPPQHWVFRGVALLCTQT